MAGVVSRFGRGTRRTAETLRAMANGSGKL